MIFYRIGVCVAAALLCFGFAPAQQQTQLAWAETLDAEPNAAIVTDAAIRARLAATGLPWRVRDKLSGIEMLLVPPGAFTVEASPSGADSTASQSPSREVTIAAAFYLGRTEVTQDEWVRSMRVNPSTFQRSAFQATADEKREKNIRAFMDRGYTRQEAGAKTEVVEVEAVDTSHWPVDSVSPADLHTFLSKNALLLPTEAQWEYACRATTTSERYGELDAVAWCGENASEHPHVVATKQANAFGFHDTLGNVWEWCSDRFAPAADSSEMHALRGGNWLSLPVTCRASSRIGGSTGRPAYGVRVARSPS